MRKDLEEKKFDHYYDFIVKVLSISKIGKVFSKDPYALDNYEQLEKLAMNQLENFTKIKFERPNYFEREIYPTPNVSVRVCIFNDKKEVLLVREYPEEKYCLPGGWCDLYDSPSETAINECKQEAGANIKNLKLIGVLNRTPFKKFKKKVSEATSVPEYVIVFRAELKGKLGEHLYETDDVKFFKINNLPELSKKVTKEEIKRMIIAADKKEIIFD